MSKVGAEHLQDEIDRRFPYPLTGTYHRAYHLASSPSEHHDYLLDLFEVTLKYCAAIAVSHFCTDEVVDPAIARELTSLERPSLGNWQAWLREILALYRRSGRTFAVPELLDVYNRKNTTALLNASNQMRELPHMRQAPALSFVTPGQFFALLGEYRNSLAHGAQASAFERARVASILAPALHELFLEIAFLADYGLVYVASVTAEFGAGRPGILQGYAHRVMFLKGGTPGVSWSSEVRDQPVADRQVYLLDNSGKFRPLLSLHPFLVVQRCASCGRDQVFILNSSGNRGAEYLSYPCTHRFHDKQYLDDIRALLRRVGATTARSTQPSSAGSEQSPSIAQPPIGQRSNRTQTRAIWLTAWVCYQSLRFRQPTGSRGILGISMVRSLPMGQFKPPSRP